VNTFLIQLFVAAQSFTFWTVVALGSCIGSFLNVCIIRIPEGTFFKNVRSVCPSCGVKIPFYLNIPVAGFFILRGKAKCCGARLSWQYPIVEMVMAVIFGLLYFKFPFAGWSLASGTFDLGDFLRWMHASVFISLMVAMSVIDSKLMIIPDVLSLGMLALSPLVAWIHPDLTLKGSLIGAVAGGAILYSVAWAYWLFRKQYGMGFGDVKLLAAIGGWLGWQAVFPTLLLGSIVGSIIGIVAMLVIRDVGWQAKIPFGPYLALGAVVHLIWGPEIFLWFSGGR
jgi:leader peptidase (prepilin peptidase) / N-methyltransferase